MSEQPRTTEPVPVQLTRIEGVVNLIAYQFTEVQADIKEIRAESVALTGRVGAVEIAQAQSQGATTSWKTVLPLIFAAASIVIAAAAFLAR